MASDLANTCRESRLRGECIATSEQSQIDGNLRQHMRKSAPCLPTLPMLYYYPTLVIVIVMESSAPTTLFAPYTVGIGLLLTHERRM